MRRSLVFYLWLYLHCPHVVVGAPRRFLTIPQPAALQRRNGNEHRSARLRSRGRRRLRRGRVRIQRRFSLDNVKLRCDPFHAPGPRITNK